MANVLTISGDDSPELVKKKIRDWSESIPPAAKTFDATKYTGKIKSYGDGLAFQRKLRHEGD